jgi:hypothetical protein
MSRTKYSKKYKKRMAPLEIVGNTFQIQNGKLILTKRGKALSKDQLKIVDAHAKKHKVRSFSQCKPVEKTSYDLELFKLFNIEEYTEDHPEEV